MYANSFLQYQWCIRLACILLLLVISLPTNAQTLLPLRAATSSFSEIIRHQAEGAWDPDPRDTSEQISRWGIWSTANFVSLEVDGDVTTEVAGVKTTTEVNQRQTLSQLWGGLESHLTRRVFVGMFGVYESLNDGTTHDLLDQLYDFDIQEDAIYSEGENYGAGLYMGIRLLNNVILNLSGVGMVTNPVYQNIGTEELEEQGLQVLGTANLVSAFSYGILRMQFHLNAMYGYSYYDGHGVTITPTETDSAKLIARFGRGSGGLKFSFQVASFFEPFVEVNGDYDLFPLEVRYRNTYVTYPEDDKYGASVQVGLISDLGGLDLRIVGGYGDYFRDSYEALWGRISLSYTWRQVTNIFILSHYQNNNLLWKAGLNLSF